MLSFHRFRGVNMNNKSKTALGIILSLLGALSGIVIFGTVIAYSFYLEGIRLIGVTKASIVSSIFIISFHREKKGG